MNIISRLSLVALIALPLTTVAQYQGKVYKADTTFKVFTNGNENTIAFGGGFNNPQMSIADLNNDGKNDLVVYESTAEQVKTYINRGTAGNPDYRYAPDYELNFPVVNHYMKLLDYNCDDIPDLFQRGSMYGYEVYKGYYNSNNQLCFNFYRALFHPANSGWVNAYCDPEDIPGIADIDGDGDIDFMSFSILGSRLQWYKNVRVEEGLHCDSIKIVLQDKCWGKIFQGFERTHILGLTCSQDMIAAPGNGDDDNANNSTITTANKTTLHTGNTLCFFDHDGDGDMDYLNGNISYPDIQFLKNGRIETGYPKDTITAQDTNWQANGHIYSTNLWPSAFWVDVDQDGANDIVITPHAESGSENIKCIAWYKNTGTTANPVLNYAGDSLITKENIDIGTGSYPMLYDYDKDGKIDMFVGGDGHFENGNLRAKIAYYRNTSTAGNPSFALQNDNFLNIYGVNTRGAYPAAGDLDNDGKDDLVVGHADGRISIYKNNAASGVVTPDWQLLADTLRDMSGVKIDSTQLPAPFIYDIDKDGKKDLIIGSSVGRLYYYRNAGSANELKLEYNTNKLGNAKADPQNLFGGYSAPFIGKIDNSGHDYLLMGSNSGILYRYTGFQNGNTTTPYQRIDSGYSLINTTMHPFSGFRSVPAVADLDGDGKYEMVMGNILGGVKIYKQDLMVGVESAPSIASEKVIAYPNPAKDKLHLVWDNEFNTGKGVVIELFSITGQKIVSATVKDNNSHTIPTNQLSAGVYQCIVTSGNNRKLLKVVIIN